MKRTLALTMLASLAVCAHAPAAAAKPPEQLVRSTYTRCPSPSQEFRTACELRIRGEVTLRRTGKKVLGPKLR